jgi:hypothetical protein
VIVGARHYSPSSFYRPYYYGPSYRAFYPYYPYSFAFSFGSGWGYPYYGFGYGYPYAGYGYPYYPYYYGPGYYDTSSSVRLQVTPKNAEVYVDGYFAGNVDNFDGTFQRLRVAPGDHEIQIFMPGHRSFSQKVYLQPGGTFRVQHAMEPLGAGEAEPARPVAAWQRRVRRRCGPNHTRGRIVQLPVALSAPRLVHVKAPATPRRTSDRSRCACSRVTR